MTKATAINLIWDYMHMHHELQKADIIFVLGSTDVRMAHHGARLWKEGWAPYLVISGDGRGHEDPLLKDAHNGKTEAEAFAAVAMTDGVPKEKIILEKTANNSQENFEQSAVILEKRDIEYKQVILVQKPYMERRAYATGKLFWPNANLILTSPPATFNEYVGTTLDPDITINTMIGDLQRIKEYPARGFQIPQEIPGEVWEAFELLVSLGYTKRLLS